MWNEKNVNNIQTIPGIGRKTAIALMVYTKGMQSFDNHRKGKTKKLALIAVANKLVKQVFAIVKNKSKYVENFVWKTCFLT